MPANTETAQEPRTINIDEVNGKMQEALRQRDVYQADLITMRGMLNAATQENQRLKAMIAEAAKNPAKRKPAKKKRN